MFLVWKNMPRGLIIRHFWAIKREQMHQVLGLFRAARNEFGAVRATVIVVGVYGDWLRMLLGMLKSRRVIQQDRRVSDAELEGLLVGEWRGRAEDSPKPGGHGF